MCIIILKPIDKKLDMDILREAWKDNPHGSGFVYVNDKNRFQVYKSMKSVEDLIAKYQRDLVETGLEEKKAVLWHSRIKTTGDVTIDNVHPFYIDKHKCFLAHNGTIYKHKIIHHDSPDSDTKQLGGFINTEVPNGFFESDRMIEMFTEYFNNTKSRIVLFFKDKHIIINEDEGEWREPGIWFSKKTPIARNYSASHYPSSRNYDGTYDECKVEVMIGFMYESPHRLIAQKFGKTNKPKLTNQEYLNMNKDRMLEYFWTDYCETCGSVVLSKVERDMGHCTLCATSQTEQGKN